MNDRLHAQVCDLLFRAAHGIVAPRFRQLRAGDVEEKSPGELVTIVDREVEALLTPGLAQALPGSRVVGEEACAAQPGLLQHLDEGTVWLVDPLDGTANFAAGRPEVSVMVALLQRGEAVACWMMDPLTGVLHSAERGGGAWTNGEPAHVVPLASLRRGIVKTRYLPPELKPVIEARCAAVPEPQAGCNSAGVEYPWIVAGACDFAFYWRTLPWDHVPGALFLQEAGGQVARLDGSAYRAADPQSGLLAAGSAEVWREARDLLMPAPAA